MPRTTKTLVANIIELDPEAVPNDAAMEGFILAANELVTECCAGANGPSSSYSDARLELIERWLAAHFYTTRDPRLASEGAGGISVSYQSTVGFGFDASHYGQMAVRLDTNGGLARLNEDMKKGKPRQAVHWLGTAS